MFHFQKKKYFNFNKVVVVDRFSFHYGQDLGGRYSEVVVNTGLTVH
jgi:hypothetical protein